MLVLYLIYGTVLTIVAAVFGLCVTSAAICYRKIKLRHSDTSPKQRKRRKRTNATSNPRPEQNSSEIDLIHISDDSRHSLGSTGRKSTSSHHAYQQSNGAEIQGSSAMDRYAGSVELNALCASESRGLTLVTQSARVPEEGSLQKPLTPCRDTCVNLGAGHLSSPQETGNKLRGIPEDSVSSVRQCNSLELKGTSFVNGSEKALQKFPEPCSSKGAAWKDIKCSSIERLSCSGLEKSSTTESREEDKGNYFGHNQPPTDIQEIRNGLKKLDDPLSSQEKTRDHESKSAGGCQPERDDHLTKREFKSLLQMFGGAFKRSISTQTDKLTVSNVRHIEIAGSAPKRDQAIQTQDSPPETDSNRSRNSEPDTTRRSEFHKEKRCRRPKEEMHRAGGRYGHSPTPQAADNCGGHRADDHAETYPRSTMESYLDDGGIDYHEGTGPRWIPERNIYRCMQPLPTAKCCYSSRDGGNVYWNARRPMDCPLQNDVVDRHKCGFRRDLQSHLVRPGGFM